MAEVIERSQLSLPAPASSERQGGHRPGAHARVLGLLVLRAGAAAAVIGAVITFVIAPIRGTFAGEFEDFAAYLAAARSVAHHADLYSQFIHQPPNVALTGFDYPPVVGFLVQPLAWIPANAAATLWLWLTIACTAAAACIAAFTLLPRGWPRIEVAALVTCLFSAATYNYWHGQMNPVIFLLLALAVHAWVNGHQTRFGVLIGIAASIKLAPILLIVLVIRRRWWRAAAACAVTVAVGLALGVVTLGIGTLREYVTHVLPVLSAQDGWLYNQSISGVVSRLFGHAVLVPQAGSLLISLITYGVLAAMLGLLMLSAAPEVRNQQVSGAEFAAATLLMLLASTITWYAHYVNAIIVVFAVVALLVLGRDWRPRALVWSTIAFAVAVAVLAPVLIANVTSSAQLTMLSHTSWWWLLTQVASLPALTATALFVALTGRLRRNAASTAAPSVQTAFIAGGALQAPAR
ncbi:MAG: glycosyltransferase family 87 protein [Candidatus Dormibacteria bacterium]